MLTWTLSNCAAGHNGSGSSEARVAEYEGQFAAGYFDFDRIVYCVALAENYDPVLRVRPSPLPKAGPSGLPSHGLSDDTFVIDHASWNLVSS